MSKRKSTQTTLDSFFARSVRAKRNSAGNNEPTTSGTVISETTEKQEQIIGVVSEPRSPAKRAKMEQKAMEVEVESRSSTTTTTISFVPETPPSQNEESEEETTEATSQGPIMAIVTELFRRTTSLRISAGWDVWDDRHVRLPASRRCVYPVNDVETSQNDERSSSTRSSSATPDSQRGGTPKKKFVSKWELIKNAFREPIKTTYELEDAIMSYNHVNKHMNFDTLHHLFNSEFSATETKQFFSQVLPKIISLALSIPELFENPIPLLRQNRAESVTLSQKQVACLLANAFLCTFPRGLDEFPSINFNNMFSFPRRRTSQSSDDPRLRLKCEKLKFIIHYFHRVASDFDIRPDGYITFARHCLANSPNWADLHQQLSSCKFFSEGTIESEGAGMLQMDFANMYIGGGVIDEGSVQEEIRFLICPELILSRLLVERMEDSESVLITGCERFSYYTGYGHTLQWAGDFRDPTPRDPFGRIDTRVVAADATAFSSRLQQFQPDFIKRELTKALAAFYPVPPLENSEKPSAVATGNWGCGVFGGDPKLKFLLQLLAASVSGRDLVYFTFSDPVLQADLEKMRNFLVSDWKLTIGKVYKLLMSYYSNVILVSPRRQPVMELYPFIYQQFS